MVDDQEAVRRHMPPSQIYLTVTSHTSYTFSFSRRVSHHYRGPHKYASIYVYERYIRLFITHRAFHATTTIEHDHPPGSHSPRPQPFTHALHSPRRSLNKRPGWRYQQSTTEHRITQKRKFSDPSDPQRATANERSQTADGRRKAQTITVSRAAG